MLVSSRGVRALTGQTVELRMLRVMVAEGIDPVGFVSQQLTAADVQSATLVLTATREQRRAVTRLVPASLDRTFTLVQVERLLGRLEKTRELPASLPALVRLMAQARGVWAPSGEQHDDIPEPHGQSDHAYRAVARQLRTSTRPLIRALVGPEPSEDVTDQ